MSYEFRPLQVVVISQQMSLHHDISWILEAVGYKVQTTSDFSEDALWRRFSTADMVILDGRNIAEPTPAIFAIDSDKPIYRIFLYDPNKPFDPTAWYAAGAHDALRTPISRGEFLARTRTGARYLEFERRLQNRSSRCALPGMYSRRGLLRKLRKLEKGGEINSSQHVLLMTSIDWYSSIRAKCGETAGNSLVNTAARAIKRITSDSAITAYLGDGRFATLLVGQAPGAVKNVAEALARDFSSRESHHESIPRPALTSAVVPWAMGSNADRFLNDALETLDLAEHSADGCVIVEGEFSKEVAAWKEEMASGNPFVNVLAQDIMEPFPAILQLGAEQVELAEAMRTSGIPVRPYVDHEGRLVGIACDNGQSSETVIDQSSGLSGESLTMPETISFDAGFPEIYEAFSSRGCSTLVVIGDDRPLGYLTCDGFLSMIDPIDAESFAQADVSADDLKYLVVPSSINDSGDTDDSLAGLLSVS